MKIMQHGKQLLSLIILALAIYTALPNQAIAQDSNSRELWEGNMRDAVNEVAGEVYDSLGNVVGSIYNPTPRVNDPVVQWFYEQTRTPSDWTRKVSELAVNDFFVNISQYEVNGQTYSVYDDTGFDQLTSLQKSAVYAACLYRKDESNAANCDPVKHSSDSQREVDILQDNITYTATGGYAIKLFRYAMGETGDGNNCITCAFLGNFMIGMSGFSASVYEYSAGLTKLIIPVLMAIWIGYRVSKLFITGGEDGRDFVYSVAAKMALYAFVSLFIHTGAPHETDQTSANPGFLWNATGPIFLDYAFGMSTEVRDAALSKQNRITNYDPGKNNSDTAFSCKDTTLYTEDQTTNDEVNNFVASALDVACSTERTHIVGLSSALAIIGNAQESVKVSSPKSWSYAIVKLVCGFFMFFVFGLSAVWFTFLVLDIVVRGLITAAFSPAIAACYIFRPTRYIATNAIRGLAGAMITALALSIVATLSFFLLTNTVYIYNSLVPSMQPVYPGIIITEINTEQEAQQGENPLGLTGGIIDDFEQFIVRIQESDELKPQIPMDFATPWFYYLVLSSLAIFSLGKKIIAMLEGIIGASGMSAMADNAMKLTRTATGLGMGAAGLALGGAMFAGRGAVAGLGVAGGASSQFLREVVNPLGSNASAMPGAGSGQYISEASKIIASGAEPGQGE